MLALVLLLAGTELLEVPVESQPGVTAKTNPSVLNELPQTQSRYELPPTYFTAREVFEDATKEHGEGAFEDAASKFLTVANLLKTKKATTYSAAFTKMRQVAYTNAALSYRDAGKVADGRKALTKAQDDDPDNRAFLADLVAQKLK